MFKSSVIGSSSRAACRNAGSWANIRGEYSTRAERNGLRLRRPGLGSLRGVNPNPDGELPRATLVQSLLNFPAAVLEPRGDPRECRHSSDRDPGLIRDVAAGPVPVTRQARTSNWRTDMTSVNSATVTRAAPCKCGASSASRLHALARSAGLSSLL